MTAFGSIAVQPAGLRMHVVRSGKALHGQVLALHSLGHDAHAFDALRERLGDGWQIVSFDQRGHGHRTAQACAVLDGYVDDAAAVLDACAAGPVHLLGHSMGGAVAALLAARMARARPGRVASLALVSSPAAGHPAFLQRAADARDAGVQAGIDPTMARWFGEAGLHADGWPQRYARSALAAMQADGLAGAWRALAEFPGYPSIVARLPATVCIAAQDDLSTPPQAMQPIVDAFVQAGRGADAALQVLPAGGHMAPLFAAPELVAALRQHWLAHAAGGGIPSFTDTE